MTGKGKSTIKGLLAEGLSESEIVARGFKRSSVERIARLARLSQRRPEAVVDPLNELQERKRRAELIHDIRRFEQPLASEVESLKLSKRLEALELKLMNLENQVIAKSPPPHPFGLGAPCPGCGTRGNLWLLGRCSTCNKDFWQPLF